MKSSVASLAVLALTACNAGTVLTLTTMGPEQSFAEPLGSGQVVYYTATPACSGSREGMAQCDAWILTSRANDVSGGAGPKGGLTPAQLQAAYNLPSSTRGDGEIVAVVDAYDNPNVASDVATYRSHFGLPSAHFVKFNQEGQRSHYPKENMGWSAEIDLDVEMVSASCPNCTIYLVEANSEHFSDLERAAARAATLGADVISNSYSGYGADPSYYDKAGVTYVASSGDEGWQHGYGVGDPADLDSVVAAGGTDLVKGGGQRGWTETVWDGAGSSCTAVEKPSWQHDPDCAKRTAADVSADGCPCTGPSVYDTYLQAKYRGWFVAGGTSVSSPVLAGVFGLAGNAKHQHGGETFWLKEHEGSKDLNPITKGSNGDCDTYLCKAGTKQFGNYSGPAGWGTPNGTGAF